MKRKVSAQCQGNAKQGVKQGAKREKRQGELVELGTVLHFVDRKLIVRGSRRQGSKTRGKVRVERILNARVLARGVTAEKKKIGRVYDIFGPVDHPYFAVKKFAAVKEEELRGVVGKKIFAL